MFRRALMLAVVFVVAFATPALAGTWEKWYTPPQFQACSSGDVHYKIRLHQNVTFIRVDIWGAQHNPWLTSPDFHGAGGNNVNFPAGMLWDFDTNVAKVFGYEPWRSYFLMNTPALVNPSLVFSLESVYCGP